MKKRIILAILSVFLAITVIATPVLAKDPDKGEGAQGVPFQELWDAVADLQEQIDEVAQDLEDLVNGIQSMVEAAVGEAMSTLPASGITDTDIANWDEAYGWGNHANAGYLESYSETDPVFGDSPASGITEADITNWAEAYGWGNHANAGYLESYTEADPVFGDSPASGITSGNITNWNTIDWTEISNIPPGFADGVDDVGGGAGDGHSLDAADGDPVDALYVDDEGNVGIGTTSPSGIFESRATVSNLIVDQQQEPNLNMYREAKVQWQSFTAGVDGNLYELELFVVSRLVTYPLPPYYSFLAPFKGSLEIYEGEGVSGNLIAQKDVNEGKITPRQWISITLDEPVPVKSGLKYTWQFTGHYTDPYQHKDGYTDIYGTMYNLYPDGISSWAQQPSWDYAFKTHVETYNYISMVFTNDGKLGIGTANPGYTLHVIGTGYASGGWQAPGGDYAEWFEKEGEAQPGDIIGINLETGKARKYRPGDWFIGVYSTNPAYVGNRLSETDEQMAETHILVGLLGQMDFNEEQVVIEGRMVKTTDGVVVGILLNNGKVLIGR